MWKYNNLRCFFNIINEECDSILMNGWAKDNRKAFKHEFQMWNGKTSGFTVKCRWIGSRCCTKRHGSVDDWIRWTRSSFLILVILWFYDSMCPVGCSFVLLGCNIQYFWHERSHQCLWISILLRLNIFELVGSHRLRM